MHSFEVEGVEEKNNDYLLDIDILTNRAPDCLCHIGMAREIGAILGKKSINYENIERKKLKEEGGLKPVKVMIENQDLVPRFSALVLKNVKVTESPRWLKEKMESLGIKSINNVVDLTNYIMLETGQPLHAFDYDKISGGKFNIREAEEGEQIVTLDNVKRELKKGILIASDEEKIIDLVGIMGGKSSEVTFETKNVMIQAANLDRRSIYLATKKVKYSTIASDIYSRSIDPNLTDIALERAYFLLNDFSKDTNLSQVIDIYPEKRVSSKIKLDLSYLNSLLGKEIPEKRVMEILELLEFKILSQEKNYLLIESPTFRMDVSLQEDLIEEVGRIFGLEKIEPRLPSVPLIFPEENFDLLWRRKAKDILKELGFAEVYNYSFFGEKESSIFGYEEKDLIEIENPANVEQKYLRNSLIPNLINNVKYNQNTPTDSILMEKLMENVKIFELGKIFLNDDFSEKEMLTGLISERKFSSNENFFIVKGMIDSLLNGLGIIQVWYDDFEQTPQNSKLEIWNLSKTAEIKVGDREIGFMGEIKKEITEEMKVSGRITVFDLDFEKLKELASEEQVYESISSYPSSVRDLSVLVPVEAKVVDVLNIINSSGEGLIRDVDLFDVYNKEEQKSLAFHIIYQSQERTLTSEEIDKIHKKIMENLEKNSKWEVRKK